MKLILLLVCLAVAAISGIPFRPTRTGGEGPPIFWVQNDHGELVPALLHGKRTDFESKAIEDDVQFYLYNSKNPSATPVEIFPGCWACLESFVKGAPVVILGHGFSSNHLGGFGDGLRLNFAAARQEMNLIFINWSKLAAAPWYETAADNTKPVGEYTGELIKFLISGGFTSIEEISYAGHSLGAHIANFIAGSIAPLKLPTIHALDPALPLFGVRPDEERIDPTDADFVNVIHTSMGTLLDGGLAFSEPRGHVDFYPTGGKHQPGCEGESFGACSHSRAHEIFGESVNRPAAFVACASPSWENFDSFDCTNTQPLGWATPSTARGIYYLRINAESPFGTGTPPSL